MVDIFDCNNCIHKDVCIYVISVNNEDFKSCIEKLEAYTTENMTIRIGCKHREEPIYHGTIK